MSYALDTNILTRSIEPDHPMHDPVNLAIETLTARRESLCVLAQSPYEFWVVATRPLQQNGLGLSAIKAQAKLDEFQNLFTLKTDRPEIYAEWKALVTQHAVMGKPAHDARIAAAMKVHGISHLLTFNTADFKRFSDITAVSPTELQ
ncbi:MAG TPA: type II toxin-antitoxin system VapC family toxin [Blastocatellia bacterium]|nr:type II toxin-antitoxin system VapC family toxin [Blastocatellia bacterium]HMV85491.1 type II toxin-antitoxin system VapC family toxin [Blastocatellia bacterium]HMX26281.1 type II toxin-antitoxin system VapC family toxin [Blastocatellia bacterium]HMY71566.1 type II toxin-antitoxin system VapC family toxin [Blastocatellia bacterium]HMZ18694.1 type II toxin-antitoxin system VapC family toxin [Blastocatellia bacterium]